MFELGGFAYSITNDIGLIDFAIAGSYKGINRKLDILGVSILGFLTALGGGITRDVLANRTPAAFCGYNDIGFTALGILIALLIYKISSKDLSKSVILKIFDAVGLAAFAVTGGVVAFNSGFNIAGIIMLSFLTAVGGGMISDVLSNTTPLVLKEDFYATCAIIGAIWFYIAIKMGLSGNIVVYSTFCVVFVIRVLAIFFGWKLPKL